MKARQEVLEKQLSATWRKKDLAVVPPVDDESTRLSPTPPPVVKFAVPPPPPPPPKSMTQAAPIVTQVEPLSPVTNVLFRARPTVG